MKALELTLKYLTDLTQSGESVVFSTSLGEEDQLLTWIIAEYKLPIEIITLDTGRLFPESYDLLSRTASKYKLKIKAFYPNQKAIEGYVNNEGINAFYNSIELRKTCCGIRKIEPLKRALSGHQHWITGLRAAQSENRQDMEVQGYDEFFQINKVNPILHWTDDEMRQVLDDQNIPVNPLHKKGFISIGCAPCTRAIEPGEHPRAGRWWWEESKKECGLHQTNTNESVSKTA